jgi:hypothetical protein
MRSLDRLLGLVGENERNRCESMAMLNLECYETLQDGQRRYLSTDEILRTVTFENGRLSCPPSDTIETVQSRTRTAMPLLARFAQ